MKVGFFTVILNHMGLLLIVETEGRRAQPPIRGVIPGVCKKSMNSSEITVVKCLIYLFI